MELGSTYSLSVVITQTDAFPIDSKYTRTAWPYFCDCLVRQPFVFKMTLVQPVQSIIYLQVTNAVLVVLCQSRIPLHFKAEGILYCKQRRRRDDPTTPPTQQHLLLILAVQLFPFESVFVGFVVVHTILFRTLHHLGPPFGRADQRTDASVCTSTRGGGGQEFVNAQWRKHSTLPPNSAQIVKPANFTFRVMPICTKSVDLTVHDTLDMIDNTY